ncbi:MAG TPA: PCYCGC motif-containing (lipo)protein [Anaerolineales bacterium]|nr:PCYCGC motif-containing (lipo)protein [Anaerolineales bacterium]
MPRVLHRISIPIFSFLVLFSGSLSACGTKTLEVDHNLAMAPLDGMPMEVKNAPSAVREAYQFNVANPEVMTQIPCYCGCGAMGHTSNYSCYVSSIGSDGGVKYDTHALGCSICVDITLDTMRLLEGGKTVPEIKAYVDQTYSQYGSSNMP